ncbi:hypothetical protein OH77DRAFT_1420643 [Trametes cingulata]|nr:hypothetical protein OH77DRAFT_1420643 [Trametes cingulata]
MACFNLMSSDIVHEILTSIPDFQTLSAAIRVSKAFYDVFQAHPKLITHAIARNVVGPALPQAARLAHYVHQRRPEGGDARVPLPDESYFHGSQWELDRYMAAFFEQHARAVQTLEDFYSLRHKDRTSRSSALEWHETLRFQRAVYRYMLCHELILYREFTPAKDPDATDSDEDEDEDQDDGMEDMQKTVQSGLLKMFKDYPSEELFELLEICAFAKDAKTWCLRACWETTFPLQSADVSPVNLRTLATQLEEPGAFDGTFPIPWFSENPISYAAMENLRARKVPEARFGETPYGAIVTATRGEKDHCSRCQAVCGLVLLGPSNMSTLAGILSFRDKVLLLPGLLPRNREEQGLLLDHLRPAQRNVPDEILVREMMEMELEGEDADDEQWSKDEWYCLECIKQLFRQRFMLWWRKAKHENGAPLQDDCWYGYNCRTMTHRPSHATKLNHLCKPTRGEAPQLAPGNP